MGKILNQNWFLLSGSDVMQVRYLCPAKDRDTALKSFGVIGEGRRVAQLRWAELSELTGCIIPCQCESSDYAEGNLTFMYKSNLIVIWHKILIEG